MDLREIDGWRSTFAYLLDALMEACAIFYQRPPVVITPQRRMVK
jgi:hypothetical protein